MVHGKEDVAPAVCCKGLESGGSIACGGAAHYKREARGPRSRHVSVQSEWRARWRKRVPCTMRVCVSARGACPLFTVSKKRACAPLRPACRYLVSTSGRPTAASISSVVGARARVALADGRRVHVALADGRRVRVALADGRTAARSLLILGAHVAAPSSHSRPWRGGRNLLCRRRDNALRPTASAFDRHSRHGLGPSSPNAAI